MKIVFVAPRFHTNQREIIKEIFNRGNEVHFFSVYIGAIEDHSVIEPELLPCSKSLNCDIAHIKDECKYVEEFKLDVKKFALILKSIQPDVVVLRGKSSTMRKIYLMCLGKYKTILYDQAPLYDNRKSLIKKIKRLVFNLTVPKIRYTPVKYATYIQKERAEFLELYSKKSFYVPFVVERSQKEKSCYNEEGILHIISVGKYREYKNHYALLNALTKCKYLEKVAVTIVGQAASDSELEYYNEMYEFCCKNNLTDVVRLEKNISPQKMCELYLQNDVFVLCSYNEAASIAVLEAMSHGLSVISTENNGTAFVISPDTGRTFNPYNSFELASIIDEYCESAQLAEKLGKQAREYIENNHFANSYIDAMNSLLNIIGVEKTL